MNGPSGDKFNGQVTSGDAWLAATDNGHYEVDVWFSGKWNTGQSASGSIVEDLIIDENGNYAALTTATLSPNIMGQDSEVPEPSSLVLLASGMICLLAKRRFTEV